MYTLLVCKALLWGEKSERDRIWKIRIVLLKNDGVTNLFTYAYIYI